MLRFRRQNPTIWTDKLRATYHIRRGEEQRGIVLARWGGLGNHRYQVGFSGGAFARSIRRAALCPCAVSRSSWAQLVPASLPCQDTSCTTSEMLKASAMFVQT